jgi:aminoglycoside phosphotransferase (APT) family kinase protein
MEISVPQLLFEDRDQYAFAMTAAPPHEVWKQQLLAGRVDPAVALAAGTLLAALHAGTWRDEEVAVRLRDRSFFEDLRVDPYYRRVAEVHPDLKHAVRDLIASLADNCLCLVHGDFSPKNLLVYGQSEGSADQGRACRGLMLVDFEVGHFGDPAFDLGFFLSHLVLKEFRAGPRFAEYFRLTEQFWSRYLERMRDVAAPGELHDLTARAIRNCAACMLARIDGKSKVEYLSDAALRDALRSRARLLLAEAPPTWDAFRARL